MEVNLVNTIFTCMKSSGPRQPFLRIETTDDLTLENWHAAQQNLGNSSPNELLPRLEIVRGGGTTNTSCCFVSAGRCILALLPLLVAVSFRLSEQSIERRL